MRPGKRRALNRGLSALFEDLGTDISSEDMKDLPADQLRAPDGRPDVPIDLIDPGPRQPRKRFPDEELNTLAQSILAHGIVQPLLLRPSPSEEGRYEIVAGERRWRAAQRAGVHAVPARVQDVSEGEMLQIALVENLQRSDLNPVEEARGYWNLKQEYEHTQEDIARIVGRSRAHVANTVRLLELPDDVVAMLENGLLSAGHARPLVGKENAGALARRIVEEGLSVREAEALARQPDRNRLQRKRSAPRKDPDTLELEQSLSAAVGSRVAIQDRNGRGEVRITYADYEELDRIARQLSRADAGES